MENNLVQLKTSQGVLVYPVTSDTPTPSPSGYVDYIDPRNYGAVYDGVTDCSTAINAAINAGGRVRLCGNGTALCEDSIVLKSNVSLLLDNGFTIKLANGVNKPLIKTQGADYLWNDTSHVRQYVCENASIEGGILDFNGDNQTRDPSASVTTDFVGFGMMIADADDFRFENCTIKDPTSFGFLGGSLHRFVIRNIYCDYGTRRNNMDGIHIGGDSYDGIVDNIVGKTYDDMVALNAFDGQQYMMRRGDMYNITVSNIASNDGYRAVRLLNDNEHKFDNICLEHIRGTYDQLGIIILSSYSYSPANYGHIVIKDVRCENKTNNNSLIYGHRENYPITIDSLVIDGVSCIETNPGLMSIIGGVSTTINNMILSNIDVKCSDYNMGSVSLIKDVTINKLIVGNVNIGSPTTNTKINYLINCIREQTVINNSIVETTNLFNTSGTTVVSNVLFNGASYQNA